MLHVPLLQSPVSLEGLEALSRKAEEFKKLTETKVEAAMAQVEAVKASENEALKRLETAQKEIDGMKAFTEETLKKANMAMLLKRQLRVGFDEGESESRRRQQKLHRAFWRRQAAQAHVQEPIQAHTHVMSMKSSPVY